jgi:hypothetical protein
MTYTLDDVHVVAGFVLPVDQPTITHFSWRKVRRAVAALDDNSTELSPRPLVAAWDVLVSTALKFRKQEWSRVRVPSSPLSAWLGRLTTFDRVELTQNTRPGAQMHRSVSSRSNRGGGAMAHPMGRGKRVVLGECALLAGGVGLVVVGPRAAISSRSDEMLT